MIGNYYGEWGRPRPLDLQRLLAEAGLSIPAASVRLGLPRKTLYRWAAYGLTVNQADDLATELGFHPTEIWGTEAWDAAVEGDDRRVQPRPHGPDGRFIKIAV